MQKNRFVLSSLMIALFPGLPGCVHVQTPRVDVRVNEFERPSWSADEAGSSPRHTPYASALKRVIGQEHKVVKALDKRDWEEVVDETGDWLRYARRLDGYADTSHDPATFRAYGDELLRAMQGLRRAARRRDATACTRAIEACDPVLDRFSRTFPLTESAPGGESASSPPAPARDAGTPHARP